MHNPRDIHWKATLRILTYTKRSPSKGLLYKKHVHLLVEAFSYSNYVRDKRDRKNNFGYYTYGGNLTS